MPCQGVSRDGTEIGLTIKADCIAGIETADWTLPFNVVFLQLSYVKSLIRHKLISSENKSSKS